MPDRINDLVPDGYYCDHSDEPWDARTHHGWEWVEDQGNVFTHQPNTINAHIGFQEYLKPEDRETRCPRAEAVYRASKVTPFLAELAELQAKLAIRERQAQELDRALGETIDDRDQLHEMADKLAYAVAPEEVIGEHSSMNCPWENALDLITPMADVDKLRKENADYERALGLNEEAAA